MSTTRKALFTLAALGLAAFAAHPASAQSTITAVSYASATLATSAQDSTLYSLGYSFTTTNALSVTALGYLNDGGVHNVEIYQITSGNALNPLAGTALFAPVSVTTGPGVPTSNLFSYTTLAAPVLLNANTSYEIVANNNGNGYAYNAQGVFYGGGISYGVSTYSAGQNTPVFNGSTYQPNNIGNFGPNFLANNPASAAPEPSQIGMLALVAIGLGALAVKARKRSASAQTA